MSDVLWAALIGAVASIVVELISKASRDKKRAVEEAKKEAKLEARLASIENKLDTHNSYADKIGGMAIDIAVIKNDIQNIYKEEKK